MIQLLDKLTDEKQEKIAIVKMQLNTKKSFSFTKISLM